MVVIHPGGLVPEGDFCCLCAACPLPALLFLDAPPELGNAGVLLEHLFTPVAVEKFISDPQHLKTL